MIEERTQYRVRCDGDDCNNADDFDGELPVTYLEIDGRHYCATCRILGKHRPACQHKEAK